MERGFDFNVALNLDINEWFTWFQFCLLAR